MACDSGPVGGDEDDSGAVAVEPIGKPDREHESVTFRQDVESPPVRAVPYRRACVKRQPTIAFNASPSALASSGVISTTRRPPPSSGTRITIPRPSLVTSSGPSPVRGFIAAILSPLRPTSGSVGYPTATCTFGQPGTSAPCSAPRCARTSFRPAGSPPPDRPETAALRASPDVMRRGPPCRSNIFPDEHRVTQTQPALM